MRDRRFFPFLCSIDRRKINVPALQRLTNNESDETERFRYSADIYENSRHVANLDASASTASISNNTRGKNDIGHAIVHRFFSPLSSLPLSLSLSRYDESFHFRNIDPHWSNIWLQTPCRLVRDNVIKPLLLLKCAKYSLSLSKKRDYSLYVCVHLECKLTCEWKERALFSTRPSFHNALSPPFHPVLSIRFLLFVREGSSWECWIIDPQPHRRGLSLLTAAAN